MKNFYTLTIFSRQNQCVMGSKCFIRESEKLAPYFRSNSDFINNINNNLFLKPVGIIWLHYFG